MVHKRDWSEQHMTTQDAILAIIKYSPEHITRGSAILTALNTGGEDSAHRRTIRIISELKDSGFPGFPPDIVQGLTAYLPTVDESPTERVYTLFTPTQMERLQELANRYAEGARTKMLRKLVDESYDKL